jgi:hypothetical protein
MHILSIAIADIVFELRLDRPPASFYWDRAYRDFFCHEEPDITVTTHLSNRRLTPPRRDSRIFESDTCWDVYKNNGGLTFVVRGSLPNQEPYCVAELHGKLRSADIYYRLCDAGASPLNPAPHPLAYPLFHLMMISALNHSEGILVHACAVADSGRGILFVGSSGAGKTTLARLWEGRATVLNDERIALRWRDDEWRVYGTPWHGEFEKFTSLGAPLAAIFFLKGHGENAVSGLRPAVAAAKFVSHCLMPLWDEEAVGSSLDTLRKLVKDVPCYELTCTPESNVVDFLRCVIKQG